MIISKITKYKNEIIFAAILAPIVGYSFFQKENYADQYDWSQEWNEEAASHWYELSQGSQLLRKEIWDALEAPGQDYAFATNEHLESYGFIINDNKPIGLVEDQAPNGEQFVGLTCAACHTKAIVHNDQTVLVHGAGAWLDFAGFYGDVMRSLRNLRNDGERMERLAKIDDKELADLEDEIDQWFFEHDRLWASIEPSVEWGFGRMDAFGFIAARTAYLINPHNKSDKPPLIANAPVAFPHIWNTKQQARLQYNGIVDNLGNLEATEPLKLINTGAMTRNLTEVTGTFASYDIADDGMVHDTSINLQNILKIDASLGSLPSPKWPKEFGQIDNERAMQGAKIFQENCQSCHGHLATNDLTTPLFQNEDFNKDTGGAFNILMSAIEFQNADPNSQKPIGTDPLMTCNVFGLKLPSGVFYEQAKINKLPYDPVPTIAKEEAFRNLLVTLVGRGLATKPELNAVMKQAQKISDGSNYARKKAEIQSHSSEEIMDINDPSNPIEKARANCAIKYKFASSQVPQLPEPAYKARPLNGIWATAPYLHNGSVATIFDLLTPPQERPNQMRIGAKFEFDAKQLGLKMSEDDDAKVIDAVDAAGRPILGNWNGGHDYGTTLTTDEKQALIEYLKTL